MRQAFWLDRLILACLLVLLLAGHAKFACAGYEEGVAAYERDDYATALKELRPSANEGNAKAQHDLGVIYAKGFGVPKDDQQAAYWYRKAAEQGYALSQNNLGSLYSRGHGVPKDYQQAYFWWLLASAQGNATAHKNQTIAERHLSPAQRGATQAEARNWVPKKN